MNCIIIDDDKLSTKILEEFVTRTETLNLFSSYSNAVDAINVLKKDNNINLIFLDIEMPEMTGIEFLKTLENPPQIIIVSSKENYALDAFEYNVTDYLLKPITYARFFKALNKAFKNFHQKYNSAVTDELFIKKNTSLIRIKFEEILWVEALENYVVFNTFKEKFTIHFTMKAVEHKLPTDKFLRVHRSFIVNVSSINYIEDNVIYVKTSEGFKSIPIGKSYKDDLLNDLNLIVR